MVEIQAIIDGVGAVDTVAGSDEYDDSDWAIIGLKKIGSIWLLKNSLKIEFCFSFYKHVVSRVVFIYFGSSWYGKFFFAPIDSSHLFAKSKEL